MSEKDQHRPSEPSTPNRIGVSYDGILAERIIWQRDTLARFEKAVDLKTSVAIKNESSERKDEVVELGDTLALRRMAKIQDLLGVRRNPERFISVDTNLSTAQAEVVIDDQGIANDQMKKGKFEEDVFIARLDRLTRRGLREVLTREKVRQTKLAVTASSLLFVPSGTIMSAYLLFSSQNFGNPEKTLEFFVIFAIALLSINAYGKFISPIAWKMYKERAYESHQIYRDANSPSESLNPFVHLARLRNGRRFLNASGNQIVRKSE